MMDEPKAPECERMQAISEKSQAIGEFLEWLQGKREIVLAEYDKKYEYITPSLATSETLLAEFFNIDLNKVEKEKRALLEYLREQDTKN